MLTISMVGTQRKEVGETYKKKRSLELEQSLQCGISQQRQEKLTRSGENKTLYMGVSACVCVDAYMCDV